MASWYSEKKIPQLQKPNDMRDRVMEYLLRLYNEHQQTRDIVNKSYKMIIEHVETESLRRLEDLVVIRMFSRNILEFRVEKLIYFNPKHVIAYIKTADNQFFKLDISIDDFLRLKETQFDNEKAFYCGMYDDLMALANSVPKDLSGKIVEEANKVKEICK